MSVPQVWNEENDEAQCGDTHPSSDHLRVPSHVATRGLELCNFPFDCFYVGWLTLGFVERRARSDAASEADRSAARSDDQGRLHDTRQHSLLSAASQGTQHQQDSPLLGNHSKLSGLRHRRKWSQRPLRPREFAAAPRCGRPSWQRETPRAGSRKRLLRWPREGSRGKLPVLQPQ
eukprot:6214558-Pleurochrysis_carterae.AAC.2